MVPTGLDTGATGAIACVTTSSTIVGPGTIEPDRPPSSHSPW
jgi:hypothetical protein